MEGKDT